MGIDVKLDKKINDFIIFCIEAYKIENKLTGKETYDLFEKYDVFSYLTEGYDMLHTQGGPWLVDDIDGFIKLRNRSDFIWEMWEQW